MTMHPNGMEHDLYPYWPFPRRPKLRWPRDARLAFCVNLYFETLAFEPPEGFARDPRWKDRFARDPRLYTWYDYGNRVAVFRILDALDRHGLRATVAANAEACERFPYLVQAFRARGYEIAAHGLCANAMVSSRMSEEEERSYLAVSIDRVAAVAGERPIGWFGQDYAESPRTPRLLAELGLSYVADWPNDDQPYRMSVGSGLISIPNYVEWDDMRLLWDRRLQMPRYPEIVGEAFAQLHAEGAANGRFFSFNIHPWLLGSPHRIKYLEAALAQMMQYPELWKTTASEVARHVQDASG